MRIPLTLDTHSAVKPITIPVKAITLGAKRRMSRSAVPE